MVTQMINNKAVLLRAAQNANWKIERATQCVTKYFGGNLPIYDHRNILNLAALSINFDNVPQGEREAYFDKEVVKIIDAFEGNGRADCMQQMYSLIATDGNIDWSNEAQVENFLVSLLTNQALNTMTYDFPKETFEFCKTHEDVKLIDELVARSDVFSYKAGEMLMQLDCYEDINKLIPLGLKKGGLYGSPATKIETELTEMVWNETAQGKNTITLDATINEHSKNFFFGKPVEMRNPNDGTITDSNEYAKYYLLGLTESVIKHSAIEQMTIKTLQAGSGYELEFDDLLCINGKPISAFRDELRKKGIFGENAQFAVGKMLRDALTDGKSVVTTTRFNPAADGTMRIEHKEIKVDLNKLNEIDRTQNHHNIFRRLLDRIGLWKIQRFPTNEQRDANQAKIKNDTKYVESLRAIENRVFDIYNNINPQKLGHKFLTTAIPRITREEAVPDKQVSKPVTQDTVQREQIVGIKLDNEKNVNLEPIKERSDKILTNENKTK